MADGSSRREFVVLREGNYESTVVIFCNCEMAAITFLDAAAETWIYFQTAITK